MQTIELDDDSAALIVRVDDGLEIYLPKHPGEKEIARHAALIAAIGSRLVLDPSWAVELLTWLKDNLPAVDSIAPDLYKKH